MVHEQLSRFKIGNWLEFTVNKSRCEFKVLSKDNVVLMLDLIKRMLNALPEIPIMAIGINRGRVVKLDNDNDYYKVGAIRSAIYNTFIETCKQAKISFQQFFCRYLEELNKGRTDYENLLPMKICLKSY